MLQKGSILIRNMELQDVKQVSIIEAECFSDPWSENAFALELEKAGAITMVAVVEKNVVGFVNAQLVIDELYINNIAVTRQCRKRGIGELLLKELERKVFGIATFVTLEVRLSNDLAQSLYKKCGYEIVGVRKNFYQNPTEDAVLMTLTL